MIRAELSKPLACDCDCDLQGALGRSLAALTASTIPLDPTSLGTVQRRKDLDRRVRARLVVQTGLRHALPRPGVPHVRVPVVIDPVCSFNIAGGQEGVSLGKGGDGLRLRLELMEEVI
jgi:hypothetical protein